MEELCCVYGIGNIWDPLGGAEEWDIWVSILDLLPLRWREGWMEGTVTLSATTLSKTTLK